MAREGDSASIICRIGKPVTYCRIQLPSVKNANDNIVLLSDTEQSLIPGYAYNGEGFAKGQCGVTIEKISARHNGNLTCNVGSGLTEYVGRAEILVAQPPIRPELDFNGQDNQVYEAGKEFSVTCRARNGRPAANLTWHLDDQKISEGLSPTDVIELLSDNNSTLYTVQQTFQRVLQPEDDGKRLICRSSHVALPQGYEDISTQINVRCKLPYILLLFTSVLILILFYS